MKIEELRALSDDELKHKVEELNKQLMELQFKRRTGVEKPHMFKQVKKDISRILTMVSERKRKG